MVEAVAEAVAAVASEDVAHDCSLGHLGESNHPEALALELI